MNADIIIIGAGIIGCALAEALSRRGLKVLLLEAETPGTGTTAAGMGHLVVLDGNPAEMALSADGVRRWQSRSAELPSNIEYRHTGTLWLARTADEMLEAQRKQTTYQAFGVPCELLTKRELARHEPCLGEGFEGALRAPNDTVLYPPTACAWLLNRAINLGAALIKHTQVIAVADDGCITLANGCELRAAQVIVAAGWQSVNLLPDLPLSPRKGQLLVTERYPRLLNHQLVELGYLQSAHGAESASVAFNVQPRATGQLLIGSSRSNDTSSEIDWPLMSKMLNRAIEYLPWLQTLQGIRTWCGFRPSTPDKLPLLGRYHSSSQIWLATGHEGLGITTALASAELLTALIMNERPELDPAPFDPARFCVDNRAHRQPAMQGVTS